MKRLSVTAALAVAVAFAAPAATADITCAAKPGTHSLCKRKGVSQELTYYRDYGVVRYHVLAPRLSTNLTVIGISAEYRVGSDWRPVPCPARICRRIGYGKSHFLSEGGDDSLWQLAYPPKTFERFVRGHTVRLRGRFVGGSLTLPLRGGR